MLKLLTMLALITPALAQQGDVYWQQYIANREASCAQTTVTLLKQLDDAKKEIDNLKKELDAKK